jgi:O-antigen ligase
MIEKIKLTVGQKTAIILWPLLVAAMFIGLLLSKFLISLSVIGFFLWGFSERLQGRGVGEWRRDKYYLSLLLIFALLLWGGLWRAADFGELRLRLQIGLPFLALPLAWSWLPPMPEKLKNQLLAFFVALMLAFGLGVVGYYFWNYEAMQLLLQRSGAVPVPSGDHIRFSLLLVLAVAAAVWLVVADKYRVFALISALLLLIILHILSVRSGLLGLYLMAFVFAIRYIFVSRRYFIGLAALAFICALPLAAYKYMPSFRTKIQLTIHNIQLMQSEQIGDYSDTQRLLSYRIAWQLYLQQPILGTGLANLNTEMERVYAEKYPQQRAMFPHNQFLTYLTAMGALGLAAFLSLAFWPLFYRKTYRQPLILAFFVVLFSSFLTENTLLISIGTNIYVFFLLFFRFPTKS